MKGDTTGRKLKPSKGTDWERLRTMSDAQVHEAVVSDPDVHPTDEDFWKDAKVILPRRKEVVTIRLDADLLEWFRKQRGYQTRINAILRTYMKSHQNDQPQPHA
ncbi:MAG TPA: BrnA antitoxin family protein [Syntrophobacteraceae bacterium]|nr:BrnA antitoxin family protein [Syntrophobacteraceae bacterium]